MPLFLMPAPKWVDILHRKFGGQDWLCFGSTRSPPVESHGFDRGLTCSTRYKRSTMQKVERFFLWRFRKVSPCLRFLLRDVSDQRLWSQRRSDGREPSVSHTGPQPCWRSEDHSASRQTTVWNDRFASDFLQKIHCFPPLTSISEFGVLFIELNLVTADGNYGPSACSHSSVLFLFSFTS